MTPHTRFPQRARAILAGALVAGSFLAPLVRRLAAPLAERLLTGRTVLQVQPQRHGVDVLAWDEARQHVEAWSADTVVLAVPLFVAARQEGKTTLVRYLVTQIVNKVLQRGKRSTAERIVYDALATIEEKTGTDPVVTLKRALDNVRPTLEVKSRRVGGATYQVPVEVKPNRAGTLALRWLVTFSRQRREKTMVERLANELLDASNGLGASVKRREDTHKMAESNKAFAHYRW